MIIWTAIYVFFGGLVLVTGPLCSKIFHHDKLKKLIPILIVFITLLVFSTFKSISVGRDTAAYLEGYTAIGKTDWNYLKYGNFEIGYAFMAKIFSKSGAPFIVFTGFIYFVIYLCFGLSTYYLSEKPSITMFVFYCLLFWFGLSAQRQIIAISLISVGLIFLSSNKKSLIVLFIVFVGLAALFHSTSLIVLILIPLKFLKLNNRSFSTATILLVIIFLLCSPIYQIFIYNFYSTSYFPSSGGSGVLAIIFLISMIIFYVIWKTNLVSLVIKNDNFITELSERNDRRLTLFYWIFSVGIMFLSFSPASNNFTRFFNYFSFALALLCSNLISSFKNKKIIIFSYFVLFLFFSMVMFVSAIYGNGIDVWPFTFL